VNGEAKCICKDNRGTYPDCNGPCSLKQCNGRSKCILENNHAHCICSYEQSSDYSDYPFCDNPCKNRECLFNGICAVEQNGEATCICKNGALNWPFCIFDPENLCKKHKCNPTGKCVIINGLPTCICKNENTNYPACTTDCPKCENHLQCSIDNKFPRCICSEGIGTLPECKTDVCKNPNCKFPNCDPCSCKPCKKEDYCIEINKIDSRVCKTCDAEFCKGKCVNINGSLICVCHNGGIPPQCNIPHPCYGVECGNAECEIINDLPKCICKNGEDNPPHCNNACKGCGVNEYCKIDQCVCLYGGTPGQCHPQICENNFCGKAARCIVVDGTEKCVCNFGGKYPNCENHSCSSCSRNEVCVYRNSKYECICKNLSEKCEDKCKGKKCNEQGHCIVIEGKPTCVCKDNRGIYPECNGLCSSKNCNGRGKCIIENGLPHCVCKYENSTAQSDYPGCDHPCRSFNCLSIGVCAVEHNGRPTCICKNEYSNWPICRPFERCNLDCGQKGECALVNFLPICLCKNGFGNFPDCSNKCQCSPPTVCGQKNTYPICTCPKGEGIPPKCIVEKQPCIPKDCGTGAECKTINGISRCVCINSEKGYPRCTDECKNCDHPFVCVIRDGRIQCICEGEDCEESCRDDNDCADDAICKLEFGRRSCVCPVPKNVYYEKCDPNNCDVCKCNPCPPGLQCRKVKKFGLVARICVDICKNCISDYFCKEFCQCGLKFPDSAEYFGCQYPDCDVCKCAPCKNCIPSVSILDLKSRFCDGEIGEVECRTNSDCTDKCSYCKLVSKDKRVCTCRPTRSGKQCQYGKCRECCPDNCEERNGRKICGICTNNQDCPIDQECGRPDILGVRVCKCCCRGDPYNEGCEWPCNKCIDPKLFREECGEYEKHAACYPPTGVNSKEFCHCHYNKYREGIQYSACKPFKASRRCKKFYNVDEETRSRGYSAVSTTRRTWDLAFGDVYELTCKKGCIEIFKSMYYCDEAKGMELGLAEKHLKIGQAICDGYERCALQAIGGIFDIGDNWKYCQDNSKPYKLWIVYGCSWPDRRTKMRIGKREMKRLYGTSKRFDVGKYFRNYQWEPESKCFGICNKLDRKYGLSALYDPGVREHIKEVIDLYPGFDRGKP